MIYTKYQGGMRPPLTVIGPRGTKQLFRALFSTLPGFMRAPFAVHFKEVADRAFAIGNTTVIPRTVTHTQNLHCLGYRIEYGGKALAYSGDSQYCGSLVRLCGDVDLAVLDCSFPASRPSPVHLHAGQCGQVAREARSEEHTSELQSLTNLVCRLLLEKKKKKKKNKRNDKNKTKKKKI